MKARILLSLSALALVTATLIGEEAAKKDDPKEVLKTVKCLVSGKDINPEMTADYKKGKVYFCCENCQAAFKKDEKKFATKANYQLVQSKQFKQEKCPLSGGKLSDEAKTKVASLEVKFCCEKCQGAVAEAKPEKQLEMVFSEDAFKKAFKLVEKKKDTQEAATVN